MTFCSEIAVFLSVSVPIPLPVRCSIMFPFTSRSFVRTVRTPHVRRDIGANKQGGGCRACQGVRPLSPSYPCASGEETRGLGWLAPGEASGRVCSQRVVPCFFSLRVWPRVIAYPRGPLVVCCDIHDASDVFCAARPVHRADKIARLVRRAYHYFALSQRGVWCSVCTNMTVGYSSPNGQPCAGSQGAKLTTAFDHSLYVQYSRTALRLVHYASTTPPRRPRFVSVRSHLTAGGRAPLEVVGVPAQTRGSTVREERRWARGGCKANTSFLRMCLIPNLNGWPSPLYNQRDGN